MTPALPLANWAKSSKAGSRGTLYPAFPSEPQVLVRRMGTLITHALPMAWGCCVPHGPIRRPLGTTQSEGLGHWDLCLQFHAFLVSQSPWGVAPGVLELESLVGKLGSHRFGSAVRDHSGNQRNRCLGSRLNPGIRIACFSCEISL